MMGSHCLPIDLSLPRRWANKKLIYSSVIMSDARETRRGKLERGRKGSCEGFPREGAAELDLQGGAEESARWTRSRKNSSVKVPRTESKMPLSTRKGAGKEPVQNREAR